MKKLLVILLVWMPAQYAAAGQSVEIGNLNTIQSEVLGEERSYFVGLPPSYHNTTYAPRRYPVLYIDEVIDLFGPEIFVGIDGLRRLFDASGWRCV